MKFTNIKVKNFRCFDDLDVKLNSFNVIIGANASGKTNFLALFDFLRRITRDRFENAFEALGGSSYFFNVNSLAVLKSRLLNLS